MTYCRCGIGTIAISQRPTSIPFELCVQLLLRRSNQDVLQRVSIQHCVRNAHVYKLLQHTHFAQYIPSQLLGVRGI